ncbi:MAG: 50S ribosomal protein L3 [Dehalococcoidales bacterium]|nr:50S ribosomal protein L3 [Dehalococcoidales bacterium]MDD3264956.1 50S ribosomal protein L3 [Dehalococcoidales bacterium]MDD4321994.1 50S ribosomal protein L3 [Dehalococcoidales bacterium]MDD4793913.1 50S ribosomal protein L3 [Dehalococcoidales bacterium]MDD5122081.1 50S ribosomal protein L3 [Dehalococcoidales bacterium]
MITGILGRKLGMTQVFNDKGKAEAVTLIEAGPCKVIQVKTAERDGYTAAQLGFGQAKRVTKAVQGHARDMEKPACLKEIRLDSVDGVNRGDSVDVSMFAPGDKVNITGITKGRGFAGVVKRHGFAGGPKTHGQSDRHRAPGSIGSGTTPGRVLKGKKMAGHMGVEQVTARNLEVIKADVERNILMVKGAVPGMTKGVVVVKKANRSN